MAKKVYILYEGDQWISKRSLVPMGVFDSEENVLDAAETLLLQQIDDGFHLTDNDDETYIDNALKDLELYHQFRGDNVSIFIKTVGLNKLEEF